NNWDCMSDMYLFLPQHGHYSHLKVYKVAEALYDLTFLFCQRFLPPYGDRTVDQMVQAARSGKQNIAEGNQAAATSTETEIKLTNVARASLEELLDDYEDYLRTRSLPMWDMQHPRMASLRQWTRSRSFFDQYSDKAAQLSDEELANLCITLCHQAIYMLGQLLKTQQKRFVTEGGIKEQMHKARTGYRQQQDAMLEALRQENALLRQRVAELEKRMGEEEEGSE
ncbi:MAG: four helix bundle suffix domain-containing protein, partial [Oscillospiraceae bacterium]|nr:four helix bundle suffix domain-containing protein [Oscillospiraceae bacterium]